MKFHDGSRFQRRRGDLEPRPLLQEGRQAVRSAGRRGRAGAQPFVAGYRKIDDNTDRDHQPAAAQLLPQHVALHALFEPGAVREDGRRGPSSPRRPRARARSRSPSSSRASASTLSRNDGYWDKARVPKLDKMVLFPMPEATTRLAALRSGQVDWIEVPPPDAVPSLKGAGLRDRHRQLSAHVALGVQSRQGRFAVEGHARAPGAQLLPQPRGPGDAAERPGRAVRRRLQAGRPAIRQAEGAVQATIRRRPRRC